MQQPPPEGTPWWAYIMLAVLVLFVLPMLQLWAAQRKQGREQKATAVRLARVDHQVTNEHQTNLRDDVDAVGDSAARGAEAAERAADAAERAVEVAERALTGLQRLEESNRETRRDIGGIREEQREVRKDVRGVSERLDESIVERRTQMHEVRTAQRETDARLTKHIEWSQGREGNVT